MEENYDNYAIELEFIQERDEIINTIKDICPQQIIIEQTYLAPLLNNLTYTNACKKFIGELYVYSSFHNINNISLYKENFKDFQKYFKTLPKDLLLYVLPSDLGIVEIYEFKNKNQLSKIQKSIKEYKIMKDIINEINSEKE